MTQPLVSVLMTSYNREKYIAEAIESVLCSTYQNFELIIVDDGSKDATVEIAKQYQAKDSRINLYINPKNLKDYPNRNKAASYAKGKYLKYLDSDDFIYPWGLQAMVYCMETFPSAALGLTSFNFKESTRFPSLFSPAEAYAQFYFKGSLINGGPSSTIIRRDFFEIEGGFSGAPYVGDTEMWLKLSQKYPVVVMPLDLVWWRQHENQQFNDGINYYEENSYAVNLTALINESCPLSTEDNIKAVRNLKNRYCRNLIKLLLRGKISKAFSLNRIYKLSLYDFAVSLTPNKYPAGMLK